jgi:hypothetical protein
MSVSPGSDLGDVGLVLRERYGDSRAEVRLRALIVDAAEAVRADEPVLEPATLRAVRPDGALDVEAVRGDRRLPRAPPPGLTGDRALTRVSRSMVLCRVISTARTAARTPTISSDAATCGAFVYAPAEPWAFGWELRGGTVSLPRTAPPGERRTGV